ncbi:MAG: glycogen/starch/alpha-glucan phosphorylase [Kiritimatiellae bacterium]|nr:glycogen/starch/alpha-glucan phosphorylase [Kiritimatiellia bacterium]
MIANRNEPKPRTLSPMDALTPEAIRERFLAHIRYTCYKDWRTSTDYDKYVALCYVARDLAATPMIATQREYLKQDVKRVYYLSMEFLVGQLLRSNLIAMGAYEAATEAMRSVGLNMDHLCEIEPDAGLGNGGLGRLAACFMESMACLQLPGYGYGIRYEHGMFQQEFDDGWQVEKPDDWLKYGTPWELVRPEYTVPVLIYGRVKQTRGPGGKHRPAWVDWQMIEGVPHDYGVYGHENHTVNILRLWASRASEGFRLDVFNRGEYVKAVESENWAETVSKVLYPSDSIYAGKELRLIQEYFLVTCSIRDLIRRYLKNHSDWSHFPKKNAIHMNDTHPALAVAELMRYFLDEAGLPWDTAWDLTTQSCAYTNHTLLPEALERWPVEMLDRVLPRHLQVIYDINTRVLQKVEARFPGDFEKVRNISLIEEGEHKQVRMTNLAVAGSHSVNGVSALHSELLKTRLLPDFVAMWPDRFNNKTNGITHRRWLLQANPGLAALATECVGEGWVGDLDRLRGLERFVDDASFQEKFRSIKRSNKVRLAAVIRKLTGERVNPDSLFDVQVKRLHEYKRQLLNLMHIITLYHRVKQDPDRDLVPRTFIFGAKAAPSYHIAKRIIKLATTLGRALNNDPDVDGRLKVVFIPDYRVSLAEQIIPAADLSEQISTAGMEASGTGNMKLALNGALTMGTWDGANIEIAEAVGRDHVFIFGHLAEELEALRRSGTYTPAQWIDGDGELRAVADALRTNEWDAGHPDLFADLHRAIAEQDPFFHVADYRKYIEAQDRASAAYQDIPSWTRSAALNVARMGPFSSDRTIRQYAEDIWGATPAPVTLSDENGGAYPPPVE